MQEGSEPFDHRCEYLIDDRRVEDFELYCRPELAPFYQRFGFHRDLDEVQLMRKRRDG